MPSMSPSAHQNRVKIDSPLVLAILLLMWVGLMWLAFPRPALWGAAHFALAPLALAAVRGEPARRVLWMTYAAGVLWSWLTLLWIRHVTPAGYVTLGFYMGLFPLAFAWAVRFIKHRLHPPMTILVPLVWVALEYLRGTWLWEGFPWFLLGHSQPTTIIQIADFAGAYGVSFVAAMTGGLVVDLLTQPIVRPGGGLGRTVRLSIGLWLFVMAFTVVYGVWRVGQDAAVGEPIAVAVVQTDVPQSNKNAPTDEQDEADFQALLALTEQAAAMQPDLIVWPETVTPRPINDETVNRARQFAWILQNDPPTDEGLKRYLAYWAPAEAYRDRVVAAVRGGGLPVIVGAHYYSDWDDRPAHRYNSAYLLNAEGQITGRFDKVHRVPFGEYLPFRGVPGVHQLMEYFSPYGYDYALTPGRSFGLLTVPVGGAAEVWSVGTPICFEDVVSYVCRRMAYAGGHKRADLLVNLTNDGWYAGTAQNAQHEQIARFRCVENRLPMARAVNRGINGFIDSTCRLIERVLVDGRTHEVAGVAAAELHRDVRRTLFGRVGDAFAALCSALAGLLVILAAAIGRLGKVTP